MLRESLLQCGRTTKWTAAFRLTFSIPTSTNPPLPFPALSSLIHSLSGLKLKPCSQPPSVTQLNSTFSSYYITGGSQPKPGPWMLVEETDPQLQLLERFCVYKYRKQILDYGRHQFRISVDALATVNVTREVF